MGYGLCGVTPCPGRRLILQGSRHLLQSTGAPVEVEGPGMLREGAEHAGVGHGGQHRHRLLLAATLQALI